MQTMPSKNRSTVLVTGVALLALVVGLIAYGVNRGAGDEAPEADPMTQLAEPENGTAAQPGTVLDAAPSATAEESSVAEAAPTAEIIPEAGSEVEASSTASPSLTTLGSVPATHLVQPGDTLYTISRTYYSTDIYAGDIEALNNLTDPNQIQVGMELMLPRPEDLLMPASGQ
ncbi:MAG: LysM peptidoglycan-binding domain-containing protein [Bacillota bacterium]